MAYLILFGGFTMLMLMGMPIAFCLGLSSLATVLYGSAGDRGVPAAQFRHEPVRDRLRASRHGGDLPRDPRHGGATGPRWGRGAPERARTGARDRRRDLPRHLRRPGGGGRPPSMAGFLDRARDASLREVDLCCCAGSSSTGPPSSSRPSGWRRCPGAPCPPCVSSRSSPRPRPPAGPVGRSAPHGTRRRRPRRPGLPAARTRGGQSVAKAWGRHTGSAR